jgi:hypothetical protein
MGMTVCSPEGCSTYGPWSIDYPLSIVGGTPFNYIAALIPQPDIIYSQGQTISPNAYWAFIATLNPSPTLAYVTPSPPPSVTLPLGITFASYIATSLPSPCPSGYRCAVFSPTTPIIVTMPQVWLLGVDGARNPYLIHASVLIVPGVQVMPGQTVVLFMNASLTITLTA